MTATLVKLEPRPLAVRAYPYDNPRLTARQFLEAIQRSPNVSLKLRMRAADILINKLGPDPTIVHHSDSDGDIPAFKIIIGGVP